MVLPIWYLLDNINKVLKLFILATAVLSKPARLFCFDGLIAVKIFPKEHSERGLYLEFLQASR